MTRRVLISASLLLACGDSVAGNPFETSAGATTTTGPSTTASTGATSTGVEPGTTGSATAAPTTGTSTSGPDVTSSTSGTSGTSTGGVSDGATSSSSDTTSTSTGPDSSTGGDASSSTGGDTGALPPMVAGQCTQGAFTQFVAPMPLAPELHIVGVYEPSAGTIAVDVTRTDIPLTLVLSSYEPVAFTLVLAPGVILEEVVLNGYNAHTVQGQGAAPVIDRSGMNYLTACAYEWPGGNGGCDTPELVAGAEALTGLTLASFAGCYQASQFSLD